ncbi:Dicarboxylate transport [Arsukibacterium tuosuense]|uniref:Dicarboxylate transport n=1 Tax=Arsukibacterium tuosuense TaxID=1323745 RepID=A0A285IS58_9GAMM|nr:YdbH domain-containing protein [Arsukibacterium tuosuense]SNY50845.1 Dicarboxylate transport [Arsukibacterium tuosuense]
MRRFLKALLILVIGLPVIAVVGYWYIQQQIVQAGISNLQLDFRRLTLRGASFASVRLQLAHNGALHQLELQNVDINWQWQQAFKPALQQLSLGPGLITLDKPAQPEATTQQSPFRLPDNWQLPDWLPEHIHINDTRILLPCPAGQCQLDLNGYLNYVNPPQSAGPADSSKPPYWQSQLSLSALPAAAGNHQGQDGQQTDQAISQFLIDLTYQPAPQPTLELTVQQAEQIGLKVKQQIIPDSQRAVTELILALSPPSTANQTLLRQWGVELPDAWLAQFQQPVQLYSKLQWQLPANGDLSTLLSKHDIEAIVVGRAPDPFYLPQLGLIQGELNAELTLKNQLVSRWQLNASGTLSELELPAAAADYGVKLNPVDFVISANTTNPATLSSNTTRPLDMAALPLQLALSSEGGTNFSLESELTVDLTDSLAIAINKAELMASVARLKLPQQAAALTSLQLKTGLSGHWQADNWQVTLKDGSSLTGSLSGALATDTVTTNNLELSLAKSHVGGDQGGITDLSTDLRLSVNKLSHPALLSQNWQWQGLLRGNATHFTVENGQLSNDAGITVSHQLNYQTATSAVTIQWQLAEIFLLAGNPLAATINAWPELLTLNRGKLSASGEINVNHSDVTSSSQLQLGDLAGIYDRSLFAGLNASVDIALHDNGLHLDTTNFRLDRLNHGFEMGPLSLTGAASLPLARPEQLTVDLQQVELQLMQGKITANNQQLDFSQSENQLILQLQQIDLASLLQQHPSSDLTGNGKLSGTVPITIGTKGLSVNEGRIAAEAPGGRLQYQSESTSAMAKSNSNMKLVFDALENFQYTVLSSDISYDTSGRLVLGLKLQGSNPNLQQGRAINLNVNLEEDLPALITSLQLTNKLNDVITQRVQQYLKQQQAAAAANGEKP